MILGWWRRRPRRRRPARRWTPHGGGSPISESRACGGRDRLGIREHQRRSSASPIATRHRAAGRPATTLGRLHRPEARAAGYRDPRRVHLRRRVHEGSPPVPRRPRPSPGLSCPVPPGVRRRLRDLHRHRRRTAPVQASTGPAPSPAPNGHQRLRGRDFAGFVPGNIALLQRGTSRTSRRPPWPRRPAPLR